MTYREYIKSPEWKVKRLEALAFHGPHCAVCGSELRLEVHHLTYERMGFELMSDLQILCKYHHEDVHSTDQEAKEAERAMWKKVMNHGTNTRSRLTSTSGSRAAKAARAESVAKSVILAQLSAVSSIREQKLVRKRLQKLWKL